MKYCHQKLSFKTVTSYRIIGKSEYPVGGDSPKWQFLVAIPHVTKIINALKITLITF